MLPGNMFPTLPQLLNLVHNRNGVSALNGSNGDFKSPSLGLRPRQCSSQRPSAKEIASSEKSWTAVHKLGGAGGSSKHMPGGECRPYLTQMPGTAGCMLVNFAGTGVRIAGKLTGI
jgi:hypothetical protein